MIKLFYLKIVMSIITIFGSILNSEAQQNSNWTFGDSCRLNWNTSLNITVSNSKIYAQEACSTISDSAGNLLFYSNQYYAYNRLNQIMPNGDSLMPGYQVPPGMATSSVTNGSLILPFPNHDGLYYLISLGGGMFGQLSTYSIVNMALDNGLGDVQLPKNNVFSTDTMAEKMCAIKHANGRDWWIICHAKDGRRVIKFLLAPDGIHGPFYQNIGSSYTGGANKVIGEMACSQDGQRLLMIGYSCGLIDYFNFNRCNGLLSKWQTLGDGISAYYGCSFSSTGNVFYVNTERNLLQWNTSQDSLDFTGSKLQIYSISDTTFVLGQEQLAPDNKIIVSICYQYFPNSIQDTLNNSLSLIQSPDSLGAACDFQPAALYLNSHRTFLSLPNMPNYNLGPLSGSACDTINAVIDILASTQISISPNPVNQSLRFNNVVQDFVIDLYDINGRKLMHSLITTQYPIMDVSWLSSGMYFVRCTHKDGEVISTEKFVKQ